MNKILKDIKKAIINKNVSWGELVLLQDYKDEILESGDMLLAEWAGISEEEFQEYRSKHGNS